jgi:hypothetical protein
MVNICSFMAAEHDDLPEAVKREVRVFADVNVAWLSRLLSAAGVVSDGETEQRARAIFAPIPGALARSRADIALYESLIDGYRLSGLLPAEKNMILVDSNAIMDVLTKDPVWRTWSESALSDAADRDGVAISPIIYARMLPWSHVPAKSTDVDRHLRIFCATQQKWNGRAFAAPQELRPGTKPGHDGRSVIAKGRWFAAFGSKALTYPRRSPESPRRFCRQFRSQTESP